MADKKYDHRQVEDKWRKSWEEQKLNQTDLEGAGKPFYNLMMFPYPSAEGLHVGNMYAFTVADIYGRFKRMQGYNVFEPIGLDGFGIHSENYALKVGRHPQDHARITEENFYKQLSKIGAMYDWSRTLETYDPEYYRGTQWLFVQMFKRGLAYRNRMWVNWCPKCKTVLSDEQVVSGVCERCGTRVEKKELVQWSFRITAYAQRLLDNLAGIDWTERIKNIQTNWIGRSEGAEIEFSLENSDKKIKIFTTRPDTLQGATFIALAPNYTGLLDLSAPDKSGDIKQFAQSVQDEDGTEKVKRGVFTGTYAVNPLNGRRVPIWVANYVDAEYGTGAIMGVPAHDERDREFATMYHIDIEEMEPDEEIWKLLENKDWGRKTVRWHLRDWLISRQRYWGPPIPMIYCEQCASENKSWFNSAESKKSKLLAGNREELSEGMAGWYPVPENQLPVELPRIEDYTPEGKGRGPLANHREFYEVPCPECGRGAVRETDVSDTFLDSAWYFLRYPSVGKDIDREVPWDPEATRKWLPVDMYTGGAEHATLHLMYTRFVTMALHDMGYLDFEEPFSRFFAHGLLIKDGAKISKSRGNIVVPDEYILKYGADAFRLYLMFMGPVDLGGDFRDTGMEGMYKWVKRLWRIFVQDGAGEERPEVRLALARLANKAGRDLEARRYNLVIAGLMEWLNLVEKKKALVSPEEWGVFARILAPLAPFAAEEMWQLLKLEPGSVHVQPWPELNVSVPEDIPVTVAVQVNGKTRGTVTMEEKTARDQQAVETEAKSNSKITRHLGADKYRTVFIPGRIINFVTDST